MQASECLRYLLFLTGHKDIFNVVEANVLNCDIVASKFELQSVYYIHFQTDSLEKGMHFLITSRCGLDRSTSYTTRMPSALNDP